MKLLKLTLFILIGTLSLTSCGSKKKTKSLKKAVKVEENSSFSGTFANSLEIVAGDYEITLESNNLEVTVNVKVTEPSEENIDSDTNIILQDSLHKQIAVLTLTGDYYKINDALKSGNSKAEYSLTFKKRLTDTNPEEVFAKASFIIAGDSFGYIPMQGKQNNKEDSADTVEEVTDDNDKPSEDTSNETSNPKGNLSKTLSEYGVTYVCKFDPKDNDEYLENYNLEKTMQNKDEIIKAWEIAKEEGLRYAFAEGENGIDNPKAFARSEKFERKIRGGYGSKENPISYMEERRFSYKNSTEFTASQKKEIEKFLDRYDKAWDAWNKANPNGLFK